MHDHRPMILALAATFAITGLAGCISANGQTGSTAFFVKDAPSDDITHLYVTFGKVEIHQMENESAGTKESPTSEASSSGSAVSASEGHGRVSVAIQVDEDNGSERGEGGRWITLSEKNTTVDLKAFNGSASAFLGDAEVPTGSYNQIRLSVVAARAVLANGTEVAVKVPGHALRIKGHFTVEQGKETALTLDFNLARSLHREGNGQYVLRPVLHLEDEHRERPGDDERRERMRERDDEDRRDRRDRE